jgi:SAM-dependent methyltransferase
MSCDVRHLLDSYPRPRPELPARHLRVYEQEYKLNRGGGAFMERMSKRVEGWMHRQVALKGSGRLLELGAGNLNHMRFEDSAWVYDIVEPFSALYEGSPLLLRVQSVFSSTEEIPLDRRYDRVLSVAVLEHMVDLPAELARCGILLKPEGVFQAGIPSEGGWLWWTGWRLTTGLSYFLRTGLDFGVLLRHEHLSRADEIIHLVHHFFRDVRLKRFPLPWHHLSLYVSIEAMGPRLDRCREMLGERANARG